MTSPDVTTPADHVDRGGYLALWDAVAAAVPDRECVVQGEVRRTWADTAARSTRFGWWLTDLGAGTRGAEPDRPDWQSPNDVVAVYLRNGPEYLEAVLGSYRARCAPCNINYRYRAAEVAHLLVDAQPTVVVSHREFAPTLVDALARSGLAPVVVWVDDDTSTPLPDDALRWETVLAGAVPPDDPPQPSGDDVHILYTGGTTGLPKGVLWRQRDLVAGPTGITVRTGTAAADVAARRAWLRALPAPPLMHGTGLWFAFNAWSSGGTVVLDPDVRHFDAPRLATVLRDEHVTTLAIVGDVFARPLLDAVRAMADPPHDLRFVFSSGAVLSETSWQGLLESFPGVRVTNALGSSETGPQAVQTSAVGGAFTPGPRTVVVTEDHERILAPGETGTGFLANGGPLPRGYLGDEGRTRATFRTVAGRRLVVSGDKASVASDGTVTFLGRDSSVVNTGGEKVHAEEVEHALLSSGLVSDALVVGRPSERWGQEVVALIVPTGDVDDVTVRAACADRLAGYKVPKVVVRVRSVRRFDSGKPDYQWARATAVRGSEEPLQEATDGDAS